MKQITEFLRGKKTYIIGSVAVMLGVYMNNVELIITGLGFMGLRSALSAQ